LSGRVNSLRKVFPILILCLIAANVYGQEKDESEKTKQPFIFLIPAGYDYFNLERQSVHSFAIGAGFLSGEQDLPFDDVERKFFGLVLYQPLFFTDEPYSEVSKQFHQIDALFDGRIKRHQLLTIFKSAADKPVSGLRTIQAALGYGYEIIRKEKISLIIGGALAVSDFDITLPSGASLPVLPLPLIRFGVKTQWFTSSFDFLTGPNLFFTIAPKEKIRFTADMRMDKFRNIDDLIYEYTLWYRLFSTEHKFGDFAGIGAGIKHDMKSFVLFHNATDFELQQTSVFGIIDFSILKIQGGRIFDSSYLIDGEKSGSHGKGFFIGIQGMIPISIKKQYNEGEHENH